MSEIEEQHLACQVRKIFKDKRFTEIEILRLWKEIEKDEIVPDRVDAVSEMIWGESNGTETVGTHQNVILKIQLTSVWLK